MTGRVSAIISAYHCEGYLRGRIDNLLQQTERPEIIIVCQNGSREHDIACEYEQVIVIATRDIPTIYEAWNIGIKAANGKYVTNANSDDRLKPNALKTMADILDKESTYGLAYADSEIVTEIGGKVAGVYKWIEGGLDELLSGCFIGPMPVWRKNLHDRFGYFDEAYHVAGDYEMWLRFAKNGVKFFHVRGDPLGTYLKRQSSAEHREPLRSLWEANNVRSKYR